MEAQWLCANKKNNAGPIKEIMLGGEHAHPKKIGL